MVGASAGGLEAFTRLLQHLPVDTGLAFVFIQHLDPRHASQLPELLARATSMPVAAAADGLRLKPNRVYVIPPNKRLSTAGGALLLQPRTAAGLHAMPIDEFCQALARDRGHRSIGIILSGTGSDGTLGLQAIKAEGGVTFAQAADSAKFDAMPLSAVNAGVADFVLTPEQIAAKLAQLVGHPYVNGPVLAAPRSPEAQPEHDDAWRQVLQQLRHATGLDFSPYKQTTLQRRMQRRMLLAGLETPAAYAAYVRQHPGEVTALYQDIFIHVTSFFRDSGVYDSLKRRVFPKLAQRRSADMPVRIWAPGCSTGEEAYSLAMAWLEFAAASATPIPIQIFATDISPAAVEKARAGRYPEDIATHVSPERLNRFFVKVPGGYQIAKPVRDVCVFAPHNLLQDPPFTQLDLLCCRNVLIYLESEHQKRLFALFHYALRPAGYLVLGLSEDVGRHTHLFTAVDKRHRIYARKPAPDQRLHEFLPDRSPWRGALASRDDNEAPAAEVAAPQAVWAAADELVMARYAPASVVINSDLEILQFRGRVGAFLEPAPGQPSHNLQKMARPGLQPDLLGLIRKAQKSNAPARRDGLTARHDGEDRRINVEVIPFEVSRQSKEPYFLVVFEVAQPPQAPEPAPARPRGAKGRAQASGTARLQKELAETRDSLQAVIEERDANNEALTAALEELQSGNEELQSTNEELQTAREELQSTNEELATLNEELENRNRELSQALANQNNLLDSVSVPIVMVGADLRIRLFNPAAKQVLNVVASDLGRPIGDVKTRLNIPELGQRIAAVMDSGSPHSQEVQDHEGHLYDMRLRPYRSFANVIDGVILTWTDITALKTILAAVTEARDYLAAIIATIREPLLVLDGELRVQSANQAFYEVFQTSPEATSQQLIHELGSGQWNLPELRRLLLDVLAHNSQFQDFEVQMDLPALGRRTLLLNGRRLRQNQGTPDLIVLAIEDVTVIRQLADMEQLRQLSARLQAVREEERTALAREVHDELGGQLTSLKMDVARLAHGLTGDQQAQRALAQAMSELIDTTIRTVRRIATNLRPSILDDLGLLPAIEWQLSDFQQRTGLACHFVPQVEAVALEPEGLTAVFRVFQEALTNIARHAQASEVVVSLAEQAGQLILEVRDNGRGITPEALRQPGSLGLLGMRERIEGLGGELTIRGTPGQGTVVRIQTRLMR